MDDTTVQERPAVPPPPAPRRLLRRAEEGQIGGVCAGLADYFGIDVTLVRIAAVILAFAGPGVPAYLITWIIMPEAPPGTPPNPVRVGPTLEGGTAPVAGVALLLFAGLVVFDGGLFDGDVLVPVLLIGGGVWLLVRDRDVPAATSVATQDTAVAVEPRDAGAVGARAAVAPAPPVAPGSRLGFVVLGLLALGGALVWALAAADVVSPDPADVLALGLIGIGAGLVTGAWVGRARWLVVPGTLLVALLLAASAVDVPLEGGFGERRHRLTTPAEVRNAYRLTMGEIVLDLRDLELDGDRVPVVASVGAGQLRVLVPDDATVAVRGRVGAGQLQVPGVPSDGDRGGFDIDEETTLDGDPGGGRLDLDLQVGLGEVEVIRG